MKTTNGNQTMKRILFVAALLLAAVPAFAQVGAQPGGIAGSQLRPNSSGAAFTTFDPSNDLWHVTLSGGNLTATNATCTASTGFAFCVARGTSPTTHASPDKVYFAFTVVTNGASHMAVGVQNSSYVPSGAFRLIGFDTTTNSMGWDFLAGKVLIDNTAIDGGTAWSMIAG